MADLEKGSIEKEYCDITFPDLTKEELSILIHKHKLDPHQWSSSNWALDPKAAEGLLFGTEETRVATEEENKKAEEFSMNNKDVIDAFIAFDGY